MKVKNNTKSRKAEVNWVVVGFVLAVIVLAILAYIFYSETKKSSKAAEGIISCSARNGQCLEGKVCPPGTVNIGRFDCGEGKVCCVSET
ncbi:MAG: hypothetical protein QXG86_00315 [Candidatus Woesearchaeota archaeon]